MRLKKVDNIYNEVNNVDNNDVNNVDDNNENSSDEDEDIDIDNNQLTNQINSQDILDAIDLNKINQIVKKKRGRPKKKELMMSSSSKIKSTTSKELYNMEEEEIILHLPLSKADLAKIDTDDLDGILNNHNHNYNNKNNNNFTQTSESINNSSTTENESEKDIGGENNLSNMISDNQYVKQLYLAIKKLKDENIELKKYITEITPMYFTDVKVYPCDLNLFDTHQNKLIPTKTNLCCWWCTCEFTNLPTYLPEKYSENNFYVSGCFCSFNCAGAYNLSLSDNQVWNRYSLLKLMYYMINKNKINSIGDIDINIAGPKELLKKYGGPMTIEEYRKNSKILGREYHKLIPPFIPINTGFEEITNSKLNTNMPNLSNILNSNKNSESVVKRSKPLNNSASKQIDYFV